MREREKERERERERENFIFYNSTETFVVLMRFSEDQPGLSDWIKKKYCLNIKSVKISAVRPMTILVSGTFSKQFFL